MRIRLALVAGVIALAAATGCSSPPAGETGLPLEAAADLFPQEYESILDSTEHPGALQGATVGEPVLCSEDYSMMSPLIVQWALSDDLHAVSGDMFEAMKPIAMLDDFYIVPMVKDGMSVCEFEMMLDEDGQWEAVGSLVDPLPGGQVYDYEQAQRQLEFTLGDGTTVRPAIFLPSGLAFAVGRNGGTQAAVYLTFVDHGPGVGSFDKFLPETGTLYTPQELQTLLTP